MDIRAAHGLFELIFRLKHPSPVQVVKCGLRPGIQRPTGDRLLFLSLSMSPKTEARWGRSDAAEKSGLLFERLLERMPFLLPYLIA